MTQHGFDVYLPLVKTIRQWSDRKKKVELPLIPGYVFVKVNEKEYYQVVNSPGVVRYVTFEGKAAPIPEKQILLIKQSIEGNLMVEPSQEKFEPGEKVKIISGPLNGFEGELLNINHKSNLIIRFDAIGYTLKIEVNPAYVIKL